jgi:hypothetical protein
MSEENQEQKPLSLDDIRDLLGNFRSELQDEMNRAITGMGTKLKKSMESDLESRIENTFTKVLDGVIQEGSDEGQQPQPQGQPQGQQQPATDDPMGKFQQMLEAKLAEQQQQFQQQQEAMQRVIAERDQQLQQERLTAKQNQARSELLQSLQGKVTSPKAFLATLEADGVATFDPDKGYGIKGKDEFQNETFTPLEEYAPKLLQTHDYSWAVPARPGSGLGTEPGTQASNPPQGASPYSPEVKSNPMDRFEQLKKQSLGGGEDFFDKIANL